MEIFLSIFFMVFIITFFIVLFQILLDILPFIIGIAGFLLTGALVATFPLFFLSILVFSMLTVIFKFENGRLRLISKEEFDKELGNYAKS